MLAFRANIQHLHNPHAFERLIRKLYRKKGVVYCKQRFGGPKQVLKYLGLYTHRNAISNHRLVEFNRGMVSFPARDNRSHGKRRSVCLTAEKFIRRFLMHILPPGLVKIRHYGLLATKSAHKLEKARGLIEEGLIKAFETVSLSLLKDRSRTQAMTWIAIYLGITGIDLETCPKCGGKLSRQPMSILQSASPSIPHGPLPLDSL